MAINEFDFNFEIMVTGECMDRLKLGELKKKITKDIEDFFEKESNVSEFDILQFEIQKEYEKQEE